MWVKVSKSVRMRLKFHIIWLIEDLIRLCKVLNLNDNHELNAISLITNATKQSKNTIFCFNLIKMFVSWGSPGIDYNQFASFFAGIHITE